MCHLLLRRTCHTLLAGVFLWLSLGLVVPTFSLMSRCLADWTAISAPEVWYPCMAHACGCNNAQQCLSNCCCFGPAAAKMAAAKSSEKTPRRACCAHKPETGNPQLKSFACGGESRQLAEWPVWKVIITTHDWIHAGTYPSARVNFLHHSYQQPVLIPPVPIPIA